MFSFLRQAWAAYGRREGPGSSPRAGSSTTSPLERRRSGGHGPRITVPSVSKIARVLAAFPAGMIDPIGAPLVLFPGFLGLGDARDEPVPATRGFDPRGEYVGGSAQ